MLHFIERRRLERPRWGRRLKGKQSVLRRPNGRRDLLFVRGRNGSRMMQTRDVLFRSPIERKSRMGGMVRKASNDETRRRPRRRRRRRRHVRAEILVDDVRNFLNRGVAPRRTGIPLFHELGGIRSSGFDRSLGAGERAKGHGSRRQSQGPSAVDVDRAPAPSHASPIGVRFGRASRRRFSFGVFHFDGFPLVRVPVEVMLSHGRGRSVFLFDSEISLPFSVVPIESVPSCGDLGMGMYGVIDRGRFGVRPAVARKIGITRNRIYGTGGVTFSGTQVHPMVGGGSGSVVTVKMLDSRRNLMLEISVVALFGMLVSRDVGIRRGGLRMLNMGVIISRCGRHPRRRRRLVGKSVLQFALYHVIMI